jgi:YtoQ family protein
VEAAALVNAAQGADKSLIADVRVFDEFIGGSLGEGKKSIALTVHLQPTDRTLTEDEIDAVAREGGGEGHRRRRAACCAACAADRAPGHDERETKSSAPMTLKVYLSGRDPHRLAGADHRGLEGLDVTFSSPGHRPCGKRRLRCRDPRRGDSKFWHDHKGAKVNAIRTRHGIETADIVVVRFGEKYKQWNAAFDAGYARRWASR